MTEKSILTYDLDNNPIGTNTLLGIKTLTGEVERFPLREIARAYWPEDFGAVGDGVNDDTLALMTCMSQAAGKLVEFRPGATYLYSGVIPVPAGTQIDGKGATLKRRSGTALVSTILTDVAVGTGAVVQVANPELFGIGMNVSIDNGTPTDTPEQNTFTFITHKITAKNGNELTLDGQFGVGFPSGSYIRMSTSGIKLGRGAKVSHLRLDGNRAGQCIGTAPWGFWVHHCEIYTEHHECEITDCEVLEAQSEGIGAYYHDVRVRNCRIYNCNGNGIHFSDSNGAQVSGCLIEHTNELAGAGAALTVNTGHNDGAFTSSALNEHLIISGNTIRDATHGIGSLSSDDNSHVIISDNTFERCIEGPLGLSNNVAHIHFSDNQVTDCGPLTADGGAEKTIAFLSMKDNHFDNSQVALSNINHLILTGNQFNCPLIETPLSATNCSADSVIEKNPGA